MHDKQSYMEKCQKILAMIEGAKTEGELKAANLALQRLMAKEGLTISEIESLTDDSDVTEGYVKGGTSGIPWKRRIASIIANNFRCKALINRFGSRRSFVFVGLKNDVDLAVQAMQSTMDGAKRCFRRYAAMERRAGRLIGAASTYYKNAYYCGFAKGLDQAFAEQVSSDIELGIVLRVPAIVKQNIDSRNLKTYKAHPTKIVNDHEVYDSGYRDGYDFGGHRTLEAKAS